MRDDVDAMFYRDYGETDDEGNPVVSVLYVSDGCPVVTVVRGQKRYHDDTGIRAPVETAVEWGLSSD